MLMKPCQISQLCTRKRKNKWRHALFSNRACSFTTRIFLNKSIMCELIKAGFEKEFHIILLFINCDIIFHHYYINVMKVILNVDGGVKCEFYLWSKSWMWNISLVDVYFREREHSKKLATVSALHLAGCLGTGESIIIVLQTLEFLVILLMIICSRELSLCMGMIWAGNF